MTTLALLDWIVGILSLGIFVVHFSLYGGIVRVLRARRRDEGKAPAMETVSVVVPARNEALNLPRLLASLDRQSVGDFDLVLVDDRSTDTTYDLMRRYAAARGGKVTVVRLSEADRIPGTNPKQNALAYGVKAAHGTIILFTDADCEVPPDWIEEMVASYRDASVGLVIGPIITRQDCGFTSRFHAFDHIFKFAYTAGSTGIGLPTGGFGNNLSVRKVALAAIGGIESVGYSTTEDAALIAAVRTRSGFKARALFSRRSLVTTEPLGSLREIAAQEVRWHIGGLFSSDLGTSLPYAYLMLYLTASILAIPFIALHPTLAILPLTSFLTMGGMAIFAGCATRQRAPTYWRWFLPDLLMTMLFNAYLTVRALTRREVTWKGSRLG